MRTCIVFLLCAVLVTAVVFSCANMVFVTEKTGPAIPELAKVKTIGIPQFRVLLDMNRYILMKVGDAEGSSLVGASYPNVDKTVVIVVTAPDAATKFFMNKERITQMAQDIWLKYLSGNIPFDYQGANASWQPERIMSADEKGNAITGYPKVVPIAENVNPFHDPATVIADIAVKHKVDAVLAGEMSVYAEVIKATDKPVTGGMPDVRLSANQYAVKVQVMFDWALFDGATGKRITDSKASRLKFINPDPASKYLFPIPTMTVRNRTELDRLMASSEYGKYFESSISSALVPYLYFFVPHFRGTYQEVKEEKK